MGGHANAVHKLIQGLLVGAAGVTVALLLWVLGWLDTWEAKTWDWRASLLANPGPATDSINIILLDQNSLDWGKKESGWVWPWPREVYGALINYCRRSGAKAFAFDVLLTEPSSYGVEDDAVFGKAVSEFGNLAGTVFLGRSTGSETKWPVDFSQPSLRIGELDKWLISTHPEEIVFPRATIPIPELGHNAAVLCNVHLDPDPDGIYRRSRLFSVFDGKSFPFLGLGAYLAVHPETPVRIETGRLVVGEKAIPIDDAGTTVLRFRGPSGTHRTYSAAEVLQSEFRFLEGEEPTTLDKNVFRDKYVFFGFSAPGLFDLRSSPVDGVYPGVEIHATMLDNLLSDDFMATTPAWITITLLVVMSLACAVSASFFSSPRASVSIGAFFIASPVVLALASYSKGLWLPLAVQEAAAVMVIALAQVVNYATEGRQKRFIKNAFKQYLSPSVIEQLIQSPERLKLGGERRILSIFFSDLQGFTSISERLDPEALASFLNDYLSAMTDIIHDEGGTVDKYEGDAIIAFWNAPLEVPKHAVKAVRAALRCQEELSEMRPAFKERIGGDLHMRIGINTGPAVVGNLGSRTRFDYTMLGDAVNLAARLEGTNKAFGTYILISQATRDEGGDAFAVRELGRVAVVGRREPLAVYEPMSHEAYQARQAHLEVFAKGLDVFYQGRFAEALDIFSPCRDLDPPSAAYEKKCRTLLESPPGSWDGVWVMETK